MGKIGRKWPAAKTTSPAGDQTYPSYPSCEFFFSITVCSKASSGQKLPGDVLHLSEA
jgi:hypothetical protein